ncbi:hypothetical protein RN001_012945 [Aquatica leii]|uniref:Deoxynucleoside kinase domain-containing protein n=1 Tax=Aquatica leii TaxID=1421715 RepID=A0AAN7SNJ7_9COLE|nr:hypothetical protein RN001_012945 [Aquatica leii]
MEGYVLTDSGKTATPVTPVKRSPTKRTNFVGISPQRELTNIRTPTDRPFRVSIEGNIGAGKSTLIKYFSNFAGIETYPEPIEWWRNLDGHNLLDLLYSDSNKWYSTFQMYVQLTRLKVQTSIPKSSTTVQMFERSVQNNRYCFVEQAYQTGVLHNADYTIIDEWFKWAKSNCDITLDLIVYLRSTPEIVYDRMVSRKRPEEARVPLEYLRQLHQSHETWLMSDDLNLNTVPVLVLDADTTLDEIFEQYKRNAHKILGHEKKGTTIIQQNDKDKVKRVLDL